MSGFTPAAISEFLRERINTFERKGVVYEYGIVSRVSDGVVRVDGLSGRSYGELLEFDGGVYGMVMDLEENGVGAVLLDNSDTVGVGDRVRGVDRIVEIPVSDSMIGRVLDPVGRPLDGEAYESKEFLPVERSAPPLIHRHSVDEPLETGIIAIDSMVPIGRGQRELIIGDRQTGKTTIALQTIKKYGSYLYLLRDRTESIHRGSCYRRDTDRRSGQLYFRCCGLCVRQPRHAVPCTVQRMLCG